MQTGRRVNVSIGVSGDIRIAWPGTEVTVVTPVRIGHTAFKRAVIAIAWWQHLSKFEHSTVMHAEGKITTVTAVKTAAAQRAPRASTAKLPDLVETDHCQRFDQVLLAKRMCFEVYT